MSINKFGRDRFSESSAVQQNLTKKRFRQKIDKFLFERILLGNIYLLLKSKLILDL